MGAWGATKTLFLALVSVAATANRAVAGDADAQLGTRVEVAAAVAELDLESENISGQPVSSHDGQVQQ